jgi:hypothetical protein
MKITKVQAEIMLQKMPEMAEKIYEDFPELKNLKGVDSWYELGKINGYYISHAAEICEVDSNVHSEPKHRNVFATKKQAESALAYAQLTQLMADCGDCEIDWIKCNLKYIIRRKYDSIDIVKNSYSLNTFHFLAFNTEQIRDEFLEKHEGLIKKFYQL